MQQHDVIGDVKIFESTLSAKAKECLHEGCKEKKNGNGMKEPEEGNEQLRPKKGMTMKCVNEMQGTKENKNQNNNKHKELMCDEVIDEDEEHCAILKDNKSSKMSNEKESSDSAINNKNYKREENKSFRLIKNLKVNVKKAGKTHDLLE